MKFRTISLLILAPLLAFAQSGSSLRGTIYDASNAVIPGASIVATNLDTNAQATVTSNPSGDYVFNSLPPGRYMVEVRNRGFKLQKQEIVLVAGAAAKLDATLQLGDVTETLDVVGKRPAGTPSATARRIRVGGNVQATRLITMAKPAYPPQALEQGIEGSVILHAVIGTAGDLLSLEPVNRLADPELIQAALAAVSKWHYEPTLLNGVPVEVVTTITVNFRLAQ